MPGRTQTCIPCSPGKCLYLLLFVSHLSASCVVSCNVSCDVFCNCCSSSLKSRSSLCSLGFGLTAIPILTGPVRWGYRGMWGIKLTVHTPFWSSCAESLGGGLDYVNFVEVSCVTVLCVIPFCFYRVETIPPVRPSSSGLS